MYFYNIMNRLIKELQECATMGQADPILSRLGAGPAVKKLVETALALSTSQDSQQRNHAYSFMESAIKELEDDIENKKIHEEELSNNNTGSRTTGSDQSSQNTEPFSGEGKDAPNSDIEGMDSATGINQAKENIIPGLPPVNEGMGAPGMMDPTLMAAMGGMPPQPAPIPAPSMQQMQYMDRYHKAMVVPTQKQVANLTEVVKKLEAQIRETQLSGQKSVGVYENHTVQETVTIPQTYHSSTREDTLTARTEIEEFNKQLIKNQHN